MGKRIAIIGAGRSGLLIARHAFENGLEPTIFERTSQIGGLWSEHTAIWSGLYTNITKYSMTLVDHPWPEHTALFPSKRQVHEYLEQYARRFDLGHIIRLRHQVVHVTQRSDHKWHVEYLNLRTCRSQFGVFDFLCICSGLQSHPKMPPRFSNSSSPPFRGRVMHSSEFRLDDPALRHKRVLVVGSSHSAIDICAELVGHAASIVNVFERPHLVLARLVKLQVVGGAPRNNMLFRIVPSDFIRNTRSVFYSEDRARRNALFRQLCPLQTDRSRCPHPDLFVDLEDERAEFLTSISDTYMEHVEALRITPRKASIREMLSNGVRLSNGEFVSAEVIVFCTGYEFKLDYLDKSILGRLKHKHEAAENSNFSLLVSHYTMNPEVENLAIISHVPVVNFGGSELQAKLTALVFSKKLVLDRAQMRDEIEDLRRRMSATSKRAGTPYGSYVEICENLGRLLGVVPDLQGLTYAERLFHSEGMILPGQYFSRDVSEQIDEINEIMERVFLIANDPSSLRFSDLAHIFNQFCKFQD
jgi:dimethylaniline monooxygenase (N-oxide forming)